MFGAGLTAQPASADTARIEFGAVGNSASQLSSELGAPVANHAYGLLTSSVPTGRMITMRANGVPWSTLTAAQPGSYIYTNLVRWATTLKGRGGLIYFAFHHEPEASGSTSYGTSTDFANAYRRVVSIFRSQGATNVRFTWQMTSYAFQVGSTDRRAAAKWYPGDTYVDDVAADGYNWGEASHGGGWYDFSNVMGSVMTFAAAHGKPAIFAEFGCAQDSRRAQWLANAHAFMVAKQSSIAAAFYFNSSGNGDNWTLTSPADKAAFDAIANDTSHFTT